MKAVILNGAEKGDAAASAVQQILEDKIKNIGWEIEPFVLCDVEIANCVGDFFCWVKTPGRCVLDDANRAIAGAVAQCGLLVFLTPVTFGGYSSELKKAVDHLIQNISPFFTQVEGETHHHKRYERYPRLLGVGLLPSADQESEQIFDTLVRRNALNFYPPAYASGVIYRHCSADEMRQTLCALLAQVGVAP